MHFKCQKNNFLVFKRKKIREKLKEKSFKNNILTLTVPDNYFLERFENKYKSQIKTITKENHHSDINIRFQIVDSKITYVKNKLYKPIITPKEKIKFEGKPYFNNYIELNSCIKEANSQEKKNTQNTKSNSMPNKYSVKDIAH
ncbi:MAG: hypothetical protein LBV62_01935 [Rickettsiales bacterium]|jgi:chromosomal replication initiation ATPase DnaA|nr:hypothetical protein [Rickettsiales bacterium]